MSSALLSDAPIPQHPFYPPSIILNNYQANNWNIPTLLAFFFGGWAVILSLTLRLARISNPNLRTWDKLAMMWFVLCGTIHVFFEGYFCLNHTRMAGQQDFFGQLWKEYALSDSRYLTSDPLVLCMETITAILWGPASFLTVYLILRESGWRCPVQLIVSTGHLYGDVLYYATNWFNEVHLGVSYSRPEAYYYWGYYVFMNAFWIVIPAAYIWQSSKAMARAIDGSKRLQANGTLRKHL